MSVRLERTSTSPTYSNSPPSSIAAGGELVKPVDNERTPILRHSAFQAGCCRFESRLPLSTQHHHFAERSAASREQLGGIWASKGRCYYVPKVYSGFMCQSKVEHYSSQAQRPGEFVGQMWRMYSLYDKRLTSRGKMEPYKYWPICLFQ
jgi:hypothetical protein